MIKASVVHRLACRYNCKLDSGQGDCACLCILVSHLYPSLTSSAGAKGRLLCIRVQGRDEGYCTQILLTGFWSASGLDTRPSQWTFNIDLGDAE